MGIRVAHQLVSPNLLDYIEISKDYTIVELSVPKRLMRLNHSKSWIRVLNMAAVLWPLISKQALSSHHTQMM